MLAVMAAPLRGQSAKPAGTTAPRADAGRGKAVYARSGCATCHGDAGQGAGATKLVPVSHPLAAFTKIVRQPSAASMPPLSVAMASDDDVADLHAFLRSLSSKGETAVAAQPAGNIENGKKLFAAAACYACHGYVGQGGSAGPRLGPPAVSWAAFVRALRHPREEMPPYTAKALSDDQVADLYAYVKTFPEPPDVNSIPLLKPPPQ
jgi:mono/diheme cytochrome c family protein